MHLILFAPSKICISIVFYFFWDSCNTREKWKTKVMQILGGKSGVLWPDHYRVSSLIWPASMQIYWNKRKSLHKKRVQLPQDWFGTPTWPPFHCFGTPIWPPRRDVKTLYTFLRNWPRLSRTSSLRPLLRMLAWRDERFPDRWSRGTKTLGTTRVVRLSLWHRETNSPIRVVYVETVWSSLSRSLATNPAAALPA